MAVMSSLAVMLRTSLCMNECTSPAARTFDALTLASCLLQMEPVSKGHCITIKYDLIADVRDDEFPVVDPVVALTTAKSTLRLFANLQAALRNPAFLPAGALAA